MRVCDREAEEEEGSKWKYKMDIFSPHIIFIKKRYFVSL